MSTHGEPEQILVASVAAIREALEQSKRGEGRPASEVMADLRRELRLPVLTDEKRK